MICSYEPFDTSSIRLLYLSSDGVIGNTFGPRVVFEGLLKDKRLSALEIFTYRAEGRKLARLSQVWERVIERTKEFKPDIVLLQHIGDFPLPESVVPTLKALPNRPIICYQEADVYGQVFKRFTASLKTIARQADIAFLVGLGKYAQRFLKYGTKRIEYSTSCVDTARFGTEWEPTHEREFDIVMISNRIRSRFSILNRIPWARIPGSYERDQLARGLGRVFGERFALYGDGWDGFIGNQGAIPFSEQEKTTRKAWLSVSWDHFHTIPCFFSNRLPTSLASGVANLTNYHPGYQGIFKNGEHLVWGRSPKEMVDIAQALIGCGANRLIELGQRGRKFAMENLTIETVYTSILERAAEYRASNGFACIHFDSTGE